MFPLLGGLVSGLGSFFGAEQTNQQSAANVAATNAANEQMQTQAEAFNAQQTQQQEQFQQGMSNTAYQRASADMKAAGLNPMMMFGSGGPASTPSGASASIAPNRAVGPAQYTSPISGVAKSATDAMQALANTALTSNQADKTVAETANTEATKNLIQAQTDKVQKEAVTEAMRPEAVNAQTWLTTLERIGQMSKNTMLANSAITAANEASMPSWLRTSLDRAGFTGARVSDTIAPVSSVLHGANSAINFADKWDMLMH